MYMGDIGQALEGAQAFRGYCVLGWRPGICGCSVNNPQFVFLKLQAIAQIRSPQCRDLWVITLPLFLTLPIPLPLEQRPQPVGHDPFGKPLTQKPFTLRFMKVTKLQ